MAWTSAVIILPETHRATGDALSIAMGHADEGVSTYCVPFSSNGQEPATHYGCHAWVRDEFMALITAAKSGDYPVWPPEMLAAAQEIIPTMVAVFGNEHGAMLDINAVATDHGILVVRA